MGQVHHGKRDGGPGGSQNSFQERGQLTVAVAVAATGEDLHEQAVKA